jgi:hypothetical protein
MTLTPDKARKLFDYVKREGLEVGSFELRYKNKRSVRS